MSGLAEPAFLRRLVGDLRQIASVRRILLTEAGADNEALAFSTGGGLDFWVTAGRMLDVATLSWRGVQIGWQSPAGLSPRALRSSDADRDRLFNRGFGGFLNTCGFDHIRQPAGGRPLHGSAPFTPARLISFGENWDAEDPVLYCEGEAVVWAYGAGGHRLRRRIEAPIGGATLRIRDTVEVIGPEPAPVMALYHFNLGYPAIRAGTEVLLGGRPVAGPLAPPEEEAAPSSIYPVSSASASCRVGAAGSDGPAIEIHWRADTLPWLQLWRDLRPGAGVLSVEPCSLGRLPDGGNAPSAPLDPGEMTHFAIDVALSGETNADALSPQ